MTAHDLPALAFRRVSIGRYLATADLNGEADALVFDVRRDAPGWSLLVTQHGHPLDSGFFQRLTAAKASANVTYATVEGVNR